MPDMPFNPEDYSHLLNSIPVGITLIDMEGKIVYYNEFCGTMVDRKPEYIGQDIRLCHKKDKSIERIDKVVEAFSKGEVEKYYYETIRKERTLAVYLSPWIIDKELKGIVQSFVVKEKDSLTVKTY